MKLRYCLILSLLFSFQFGISQSLPSREVIKNDQLSKYLNKDVKEQIAKNGTVSEKNLAAYFRMKFSERYFYDWNTFNDRFELYNEIYDNQTSHLSRAEDHMGKYGDSTVWKLPFNYLNGEEVNAYALRHLARQHKMVDIAFRYFYENRDPVYIEYFEKQMASLNVALEIGEYEKIEDGNGTYENFRSGYRALNWMRIHTMFLGEAAYSDEYQLTTIATLLQQGAHLYAGNTSFTPGNHQTRGVSALAMIAILLRDFKGTDKWLERAMMRLNEHLEEEINNDGFQSERSVHYHMSDIGNYYFVYQLSKINGIDVGKEWEEKLRSLFTTLVKIAYPDKTAPVLQDDTDNPWGENNDISGALTLGYLLFEDPEFGYFVDKGVKDKMYWFLQERQLEMLKSVSVEVPVYGSLIFPDTHYYVMREGWDENDKMMIISAGLDEEKPSHQHGDMLGVQAIANGKNVLPNYQVRYSLPDFDLFKNSMVKNVALVDDELLGKQWTPNEGRTGYGQFLDLPNPTTIVWKTNSDFDLFVGSHDGFENVNVGYNRQVIYIKDDFWIVKDNFKSGAVHEYKQIWQGHYTVEDESKLIRATFEDATGFDVFQLRNVDEVASSGARGKQWSVISKKSKNDFSFITVLYPYKGYGKRIDELAENPNIKDWELNNSSLKLKGENVISLSKKDKHYIFDMKGISIADVMIESEEAGDFFIKIKEGSVFLVALSPQVMELSIKGGADWKLNGKEQNEIVKIKPGEVIECNIEIKKYEK